MNGLFISLYDVTADHVKGIHKKIQAQVKYLNKNCDNIDWIYKISDGYIMKNEKIMYQGNLYDKEMISTSIDFINLKKYIDINNYDFIYIRYIIGNLGLLNFVKYANKKNIKILIEIPTYPYIDEINYSLQGKIKRIIDSYITSQLKKYVYRIVCTNKDNEIFGIPTIKIDNGVDLEKIKCISNKNEDNNIINAIGVASICSWHGYDRFINAMYQYKKVNKLDLKLYLVGEGRKEDMEYLKELVHKKGLSNYVFFTGAKDGKELDDLYEKMDFAVSSLALFRAGGGHNPIKTKEYIAKGLPVVTGYEDSLVPSTLPYIYKVKEDETIFDLKDIIEWYKNGNFNVECVRKYAEQHVSWDSQIKKVISEIKRG